MRDAVLVRRAELHPRTILAARMHEEYHVSRSCRIFLSALCATIYPLETMICELVLGADARSS